MQNPLIYIEFVKITRRGKYFFSKHFWFLDKISTVFLSFFFDYFWRIFWPKIPRFDKNFWDILPKILIFGKHILKRLTNCQLRKTPLLIRIASAVCSFDLSIVRRHGPQCFWVPSKWISSSLFWAWKKPTNWEIRERSRFLYYYIVISTNNL